MLRMCSPRLPAIPVAGVCRGVPVGTPASRAPAHTRRRVLARARGSGGSRRLACPYWPLPANTIRPCYRRLLRRILFAPARRGCAVTRPLSLGGFLAWCAHAGRGYYGTHCGTALGFCRGWPFRPPLHHAMCRVSCQSSCVPPPQPPRRRGGFGLAAVVFTAYVALYMARSWRYAIVRHRPPPNYAIFQSCPQFCNFLILFHNIRVKTQ